MKGSPSSQVEGEQYDDTFIIPDRVIIITGSPGKVISGVSCEF